MTRDFSTDLTILVTGSGNSTVQNIQDNLTEWIFGGNDERNVRVIIPFTELMGKGMENFITWGEDFFQWGDPEGDPFHAVVMPERGHKIISKATGTHQVTTLKETLDMSLELLTDDWQNGNEVAVISIFAPDMDEDMEFITEAKKINLLPVFNLSEGMIDSFDGYQSEESIMVEGAAREKFLLEEAQKDAIASLEKDTKSATKKAPAPRKRAAKKTTPPSAPTTLKEPEKPLQDLPVGTVVEVAGTEFTKIGPNPFREPLPGNPIHDQKITKDTPLEGLSEFAEITPTKKQAEDNIWSDSDKILVSKKDLTDLAEGINLITKAFTRIMGS